MNDGTIVRMFIPVVIPAAVAGVIRALGSCIDVVSEAPSARVAELMRFVDSDTVEG